MTTSISLDPTEDQAKQEPMTFIRTQIIDLFDNQYPDYTIEERVEGTTLEDIDQYLIQLADNTLPQKALRIRASLVEDLKIFQRICEHLEIDVLDVPCPSQQRIYFLEDENFAITFIPVNLGEGKIDLQFQPLVNSPQFIRKIYDSLEDTKKIGNKEALKKLKFIKFDPKSYKK